MDIRNMLKGSTTERRTTNDGYTSKFILCGKVRTREEAVCSCCGMKPAKDGQDYIFLHHIIEERTYDATGKTERRFRAYCCSDECADACMAELKALYLEGIKKRFSQMQ